MDWWDKTSSETSQNGSTWTNDPVFKIIQWNKNVYSPEKNIDGQE